MEKKMDKYFNEELNITIKFFTPEETELPFTISEEDDRVFIYDKDKNKLAKVCRYSTVSVSIGLDNIYKLTFWNDSQGEVFSFFKVVLKDKSYVVIREKTIAESHENSTVSAFDESFVYAFGHSNVDAYDKSTIIATGFVKVVSCFESTVRLYKKSSCTSNELSKVYAYDQSIVKAKDNSKIFAYDKSIVNLMDFSSVRAEGFSTIYNESALNEINTDNHFGAVINCLFRVKRDLLVYKRLQDDRIATLKLKKGQFFQSRNHEKCRTSRVFVVSIESIDGKESFSEGRSIFLDTFVYTVGKYVFAKYDKAIRECSSGIHFFLSKESAKEYNNN
jgi:hypothetical protein